MIDSYVDYLIEKDMNNEIHYPYLLKNFLVKTTRSELESYFSTYQQFYDDREGQYYRERLCVTERGMKEINNYMDMMRRPVLKIPFSKFAKLFALLHLAPEPEVKRIKITSAELAEEHDVLYNYFGSYDYLGFFTENFRDVSNYDMVYMHDYEEYIRDNYDKKIVAEKYLSWVAANIERKEGDLIYDVETLQLASKSMSQRDEYTEFLDSYDDFIVPSDGLGVLSCMAIMRDKHFYSWEPNPVGKKAIALGLIHSKEPKYEPKLYVFFYCVQYYQLPFFPGQEFLIIDVPTVRKPGHQLNLYVSVSHKKLTFSHLYPPEPMSLNSVYCLDVITERVTAIMKVPHVDVLSAQFIVVANSGSLEASLQTGFYSKEYWKGKFDKMSKKEKKRYETVDLLLKHVKEKTLMIFERNFPFRRGVKTRWRVENDVVKRDFGPGWYFVANAMWYGNNFSPGDVRRDYSFDSGYFIFKDSTRPKAIVYVSLEAELEEVYETAILKLAHVSTYRLGSLVYLTYVPESKILRKPILIDEV